MDMEISLYNVARRGETEALKELLEQGHDFNGVGGDTPLKVAAKNGHYDCVELLLQAIQANASLEEIKKFYWSGVTPISLAASRGHWKVVSLLSDLYLNASVAETGYALHSASKRGREINCIKVLADKFPQHVHKVDKWGDFPVHHTNNFDSVKALLQAGADVNVKRARGGSTVLHHLCGFGNADNILVLLEWNCDVNVRDEKGRTPLYYTAKYGRLKALKILLANGADATILTHAPKKKSPLSSAAGNGHLEVVKILGNVTPREFGTDAIIRAAYGPYYLCLEYLLENGFPTFNSSSYPDENNPWNEILYDGVCGNSLTVEMLLRNGTQFCELANFGNLSFMPNRLHHHCDPSALEVFFDFGLAEIQWNSCDCSKVNALADLISQTAELAFGEYSGHGDREDGGGIDENRVGESWVDKKQFIWHISLYFEYFPFATLLKSETAAPDVDVLDKLNSRIMPVLPTLTRLCIWTIRCCIVRGHGSILTEYIRKLPFPKKLQNLLMYNRVNREQEQQLFLAKLRKD